MQKKTTLILVVAALFSSCGKDKKENAPPPITTVELESIQENGCLNLPAYFSKLQSLDQQRPVREVSTDLEFSSKKPIRSNFRKILAYTTFQLGAKPLGEYQEFQNITQEGCEAITLQSADGAQERYAIREASKEKLFAEHEDGRWLLYSWLGPQRMQIEQRYHAYDLPCTKGDPILVKHRRVLDWTQEPFASIPSDSVFEISQEYLSLVAEAVGGDLPSLFEPGPRGQQLLVVSRAQELASRPIRQELLACSAPQPSAPSEPIGGDGVPGEGPLPPGSLGDPATPDDPALPPEGEEI